jgi:inosose dehydratase
MLTTFENEKTFEAFEKHLDYTYSLGARVVGVGECGVTIHGKESVPLFSSRPILSDEQFENLASGLNEMGRRAKAKGMSLCFHHHMGTGIESMVEIDRLMSMTNQDLVYLLFDTGHLSLAGEDPTEILRKYIHRVRHIHFKDLRKNVHENMKSQNWSFLKAVKEGIFTVPGDGDMVNWKEIFSILKNSDYSGWIVIEAEQDPSKADPLEYAMIARKFLRENLEV